MIYRPSNSVIERLRALFKRRVGDTTIAFLGDSDGAGARIDVPGKMGYVYVRFPNGRDTNGNVIYSSPFMVWSAGASYPNSPGFAVNVGFGDDGELEIRSANKKALRQAGINTASLNLLNQQSKFVYPWQWTVGLVSAVATALTSSTLVTVKSFRHYVANIFQTFETPLEADKIDLASYIPAADMQCLAAIWIDTYTNLPEVTTSTPQALNVPFDASDFAEMTAGRPPDAMPLKAFILANGQVKVFQSPINETDLRQHLDTPVPWGFPHTLTTRERVRPGYTLVVGPYTESGAGDLTPESGGRVLNVHKSNVAASAPSVNDDSADGYDIGSRWFDTSTGLMYVATDVTVGAAVWTVVATSGSFAPSNAHYVTTQAESGLSNEFNLGGLSNGILKQTVSTGVSTPAIAVAGTDYTTPTGTENLSNKTVTASTVNSTPVGTTTAAAGYFSALRLLIGGFFGIFTHANSADRTYTLQNASGTLAFLTDIPAGKSITRVVNDYSSNTTHTIPTGTFLMNVWVIGAGGGGASGRRGGTLTNRGGGGGGGGGAFTEGWFTPEMLSGTINIVVGTGGTNGASRTTNDTGGANGGNGGASYFGGTDASSARLTAIGGGGGGGGGLIGGTAGAGNTTFSTASQVYGSGGTAGTINANAANAQVAARGPGGGGGGGGLSDTNAAFNGGAGAGLLSAFSPTANGTGGGTGGIANSGAITAIGGTGTAGTTDGTSYFPFGTGGGGGSPTSGIGAAGGAGAAPGGGGGGGGASLNGNNSGAGGSGANGRVIVISYVYS